MSVYVIGMEHFACASPSQHPDTYSAQFLPFRGFWALFFAQRFFELAVHWRTRLLRRVCSYVARISAPLCFSLISDQEVCLDSVESLPKFKFLYFCK